MSRVNCLYCGARIPDDLDQCPQCGAPSHFQQRGYRLGGRRRFMLLFTLFALAVIAVAFWFPR